MSLNLEQDYIFTNTTADSELVRLQLIEEIFDPATFAQLKKMGLSQGNTCLEVGAGAGSVMRWICDRVGETGQVVAVDLDPRFISGTELPNLEIRQGDICAMDLEPNRYDLIHLRYVLVHVQDYNKAIANLVQALKPGGKILIEEPDFLDQAPAAVEDASKFAVMDRMFKGVLKLHQVLQVNSAIARQMPSLLQQHGLQNVSAAAAQKLAPGGSKMARMMKMSLSHIAEKLIKAGTVSAQDVEIFLQEQDNPRTWVLYYSTIAAWGTKGALKPNAR
ncbi:Methyltransferase type 11 [Thalassoporum mexicanum PCC 7367]|uniref:methyltransferase domain-containing protein n=1 Tax=Thalassoporum mexicanum TaxID=3457544 RepID=UPI00029FAB70|nr:methyltransferase domain-containing protein [Pseudanabaena sp. PCC 7367]AFY71847.1 Methyltransferase type 11 [Pseudanabaena sp. PCC 7367]